MKGGLTFNFSNVESVGAFTIASIKTVSNDQQHLSRPLTVRNMLKELTSRAITTGTGSFLLLSKMFGKGFRLRNRKRWLRYGDDDDDNDNDNDNDDDDDDGGDRRGDDGDGDGDGGGDDDGGGGDDDDGCGGGDGGGHGGGDDDNDGAGGGDDDDDECRASGLDWHHWAPWK